MRINLKDGRYIKVNIEINEKGVYEYYTDGILIGVYAPNTMKDSKFLKIDLEKNNTINNELSAEIKDDIRQIIDQVKDKIEQTGIKDIDAEAKENKALDGYMREIGVDRERVRNIVVMDLEREKKQEEKKDKEKEEENKSKRRRAEEQIKSNNPNINTPKVTKKDVNLKQEIGLEERANDVQDFKRWIGGKLPDDIQKIGVIESDEMSKMKDDKGRVIDNSSTRFALVVIGKDGRVEPLKKYIPQLKQNHSSGNNPIKTQYQINTNGEVEKDAVLSEYRIGNKIIQLDKDQGDDLEVNIGQYSPSGNNLVTTRMRDRNTTFKTDTETRKAVNGYYDKGVYASKNSYKEAKKHEENNPDCDKMNEKDIDGDPNTKSHIHNENLNFNELAVKWGLIKNGRPDAEKARQVYEKEANNNLEKSKEEIIKMVSEEMENDYRPMNMAQ